MAFNISFDTFVSGGNVNPGTALGWNHTIPSDHPLLKVDVLGDTGGDKVTGATCAGIAMQLAGKVIGGTGGSVRDIYTFLLENPPAGVQPIQVNASVPIFIAGQSSTYLEAQATSTPDNVATAVNAGTASFSMSLLPVRDRCWVLMYGKNDGGAPSAGAGTTMRGSQATGGMGSGDNNGAVSPPSLTTLTMTQASAPWSGIIVTIAPFTSGPGRVPQLPPFSVMRPHSQPPLVNTFPAPPAAPAVPNTPSPANGANAYYSTLSWLAAGQAQADIYLGTSATPPLLIPDFVGFSTPVVLQPNTTYFWQIVAKNAGGATAGPVWSFTTFPKNSVIVWMAGRDVSAFTQFASIDIQTSLASPPNTFACTMQKTANPTEGMGILVGVGSLDPAKLIFGGEIQSMDETVIETTKNVIWNISAVDMTFVINKRMPLGSWQNVSATIIAKAIIASFAPGFTSNHVQVELPAITISFDGQSDFMTCMGSIATALNGAKTRVDYVKDVHLYFPGPPGTGDDDTPPADPVDATHPTLTNPNPIIFTRDLSQIRTQCLGKGKNTTTPSATLLGESIIPVKDMIFSPTGSSVWQDSGVGYPLFPYAATQPSLITVVSLTSAMVAGVPTATVKTLTAHGLSTNDVVSILGATPAAYNANWVVTVVDAFTFTFVLTTLLASPALGNITVLYTFSSTTLGNSTLGLSGNFTCVGTSGGSMGGGTYLYHATIVPTTGGETIDILQGLGGVSVTIAGGATASVTVTSPSWSGFPLISKINIYRSPQGLTTPLKFVGSITTSGGSIVDTTPDSQLNGALIPTSSTAGFPTGSAIVSVNNASRLPTSGWVQVGSALVRYTSVSGSTLGGIPTSGVGSITGNVAFGTAVTLVPALIGVNNGNGLPYPMASGTTISLYLLVDDLTAQAALGQLELDTNGNPTDGIRQFPVTDTSADLPTLLLDIQIEFQKYASPVITVVYYTRDIKSTPGKIVPITVPWNGLSLGNFTIQQVEISLDAPDYAPLFMVTASNSNLTLNDILRAFQIGSSS